MNEFDCKKKKLHITKFEWILPSPPNESCHKIPCEIKRFT